MPPMARPPRIPVWLADGQTVTYFLTLCVAERKAVLDNPKTFHAIKTFCSENENWRTIAAVVMPNHFHALIRPQLNRDAKPTQFSAGLKRFVQKRTKTNWKWQDGVFDRLLRRNEFIEAKWHYMRENPVRTGLVRRWEDWPYIIHHQNL
jgi:putative transposase